MAVKVRQDLLNVALRVQREFADPSSALIDRAHIEAAIAAQAASPKEARLFNDEEYAALLRLRSWAFKAPDNQLRLP